LYFTALPRSLGGLICVEIIVGLNAAATRKIAEADLGLARQVFGECGADQPRDGVGAAAGIRVDDDVDGLALKRNVGPGGAGKRRNGGSEQSGERAADHHPAQS
jgi:hypothetical protein